MRTPDLDDLSARARIRVAAIDCIGRFGAAGASMRRIADEAGVTAGLITHYFGSKAELVAECTRAVTEEVLSWSMNGLLAGFSVEVEEEKFRDENVYLLRYVRRLLLDGDGGQFVDRLVAEARKQFDLAAESGRVIGSAWPKERALIVVLIGLMPLIFESDLKRYEASPNGRRRLEAVGALAELYTKGLFASTDALTSVERAIKQRDAQLKPDVD